MPVIDPVEIEMGEAKAPDERDRLLVVVRPAARAIARFMAEEADTVLGGRFQDWPFVSANIEDEDLIRTDPANGLFGLQIISSSGFLAEARNRDAINRAIHRNRFLAAFNADGWVALATIRPPAAAVDPSLPLVEPEWASSDPMVRRGEARERANAWRSRNGKAPMLRIALPDGPGSRMLYAFIASDLNAAGIDTQRVTLSKPAELRLIDEVAPSDDPAWYLQRLSCSRSPQCSRAAQAKLDEALALGDTGERNAGLVAAELEMQRDPWYIPLSSPLRWSLVSPRLSSFRVNVRARHPLNQLRRATT